MILVIFVFNVVQCSQHVAERLAPNDLEIILTEAHAFVDLVAGRVFRRVEEVV